MPKNPNIKSILIIGSGPIVIGQACEFDYAGSQAARSLREEGIKVSLINSNPATIMTDPINADHVYLLPLEKKYISPDSERAPGCRHADRRGAAHDGRPNGPKPGDRL